MGHGQHGRLLHWLSHWQRSLIFIVRASTFGAGHTTKHRNNARQPARGKWDRRNADRPATSSPSIHRPK
jgi:hypothetical protein